MLKKTSLLQLLLIFFIILADQISKFWIIRTIPLTYPPSVAFSWFNNGMQIIHVRNPGVIFSTGSALPLFLRVILFIVMPILVLLFLLLKLLLTPENWLSFIKKLHLTEKDDIYLNRSQQFAFSAIIGGGFGNIIDRIFRVEGVVDFIDLKFWGLFGWERFPTFNVADSAVTIAIAFLVIFALRHKKLAKV